MLSLYGSAWVGIERCFGLVGRENYYCTLPSFGRMFEFVMHLCWILSLFLLAVMDRVFVAVAYERCSLCNCLDDRHHNLCTSLYYHVFFFLNLLFNFTQRLVRIPGIWRIEGLFFWHLGAQRKLCLVLGLYCCILFSFFKSI